MHIPTNKKLLESNLCDILNTAYLKNSKLRQAFGKKNLSSCLNHSLLIAVSCVKKRDFVKSPFNCNILCHLKSIHCFKSQFSIVSLHPQSWCIHCVSTIPSLWRLSSPLTSQLNSCSIVNELMIKMGTTFLEQERSKTNTS